MVPSYYCKSSSVGIGHPRQKVKKLLAFKDFVILPGLMVIKIVQIIKWEFIGMTSG